MLLFLCSQTETHNDLFYVTQMPLLPILSVDLRQALLMVLLPQDRT